MSKILVLAEKPSVGRDIARVLNCNRKNNGYLENEKYIVTWALGHLVTLAAPEIYDKKYKSWNFEDLPMLPSKLELVVIKKTSKQFNTVKKQMLRADVNEIVIATDAGREGELVARWIIEKAHVRKPLKRLWISSVTDKAIKDGFRSLKDGRKYENLYKSAVGRSEADWYVGLNITRALTCKYNASLSAGRVQTPTLAMIVKREEEIKNFVPKEYYNILGKHSITDFQWSDSRNNQTRIFNKDRADNIISKIKNKTGEVLEVKKTPKKKNSPLLYDLTELQRDANNKFGYSAKKTLSLMQRLYESHKLLTYPRTDSRYVTTDIVPTIKERLKNISIGPYREFCSKILKNKIVGNKNFVNNSKVSDHHAIIPTEETVKLSMLNNEEKNIYDLVVKRFLSVLYPAFEYDETTVKVSIDGEIFGTKGRSVKIRGWKEVYGKESLLDDEHNKDKDIMKSQFIPNLKNGDKIKLTDIKIVKGETKAPARFNEATLLSAMENPQKYMNTNNKELVKAIENTGGLGTVATRADIIEKLFNIFYLEKKGKTIYPTSKGKQLIDLVPDELKSPILTAKWEQQLSQISNGDLNDKKFIKDMQKYASKLVLDVKNSKEKYKHDNITGEKCPECGKYLLRVNGKKGKMLVCQDRECGYRKPISKITNARCPECHKKMELRGQGEGQVFVCPNCSYKEKLSSFNKRRKSQGDKLNKKDVSKYIKKINNENKKPINSALADALSKLKM